MEIGKNYVKVSGYVKYPKLMRFENDSCLFMCSIGIPLEGSNRLQNISGFKAWGDMGEALYELGEDALIRVVAHIETSVYSKKCRMCKDSYKVYDKEFVIDLYKVIER